MVSEYERIFSLPIRSTEAKHLPQDVFFTERAKLLDLAISVRYPYPFVGQHQDLTAGEDRHYVFALARSGSLRPPKFVLTSDGRIWADNTHWSLVCLLRWGNEVRVGDVPSYLIDVRFAEPRLINRPASLLGQARVRATEAALEIERRLSLGWRPAGTSFLLADLLTLGRYDGGARVVGSDDECSSATGATNPVS